MNKDTFEWLFVWQLARDVFCDLYNDTISWKDYYLKDQILRATLSISNNIAEWYERQTENELIRFLYIARWSAWEVRSMLLIAKKLNLLWDDKLHKYFESINKISSWIYRRIKTISKS